MFLSEMKRMIDEAMAITPGGTDPEILIHMPDVRPSSHSYCEFGRIWLTPAGWLCIEPKYEPDVFGSDGPELDD